MRNRSLVFVKFPRYGLGNLMLLWANAFIFSHLNNLPFLTSPWWGINFGSWFRKEKNKRFYYGYFKSSSIIEFIKYFFILLFAKKFRNNIFNKQDKNNNDNSVVFYYNSLIFSNQMFLNILPYRDILKREILNLLKVDLRNQYFGMSHYDIGIHIRRGDFVVTDQATSIDYFITVLKIIRESFHSNMKARIFSDAYDHELAQILSFDGVSRSSNTEDILDLLELSKCKIIVMSKSSTFSYWAGFLSSGLVVKAKDDWQERICFNPDYELIFDLKEQDAFRHSLKSFSDLSFTG
jgi:hypothetical protein